MLGITRIPLALHLNGQNSGDKHFYELSTCLHWLVLEVRFMWIYMTSLPSTLLYWTCRFLVNSYKAPLAPEETRM